jgi:hypothetical protein
MLDLDHPDASEALDWSRSIKTLNLMVNSTWYTISELRHTESSNQDRTSHHTIDLMVRKQVETKPGRTRLAYMNRSGSRPIKHLRPVQPSLPSLVSLSRVCYRAGCSPFSLHHRRISPPPATIPSPSTFVTLKLSDLRPISLPLSQ